MTRSETARRAQRLTGLACSEALLRQWETDGTLPGRDSPTYEESVIAALRLRSAGASKAEVRRTLKLPDPDAITAIEPSLSDDEFLVVLQERVAALRTRGLSVSDANLKFFQADPASWVRYRGIMTGIGTRAIAREGEEEF